MRASWVKKQDVRREQSKHAESCPTPWPAEIYMLPTSFSRAKLSFQRTRGQWAVKIADSGKRGRYSNAWILYCSIVIPPNQLSRPALSPRKMPAKPAKPRGRPRLSTRLKMKRTLRSCRGPFRPEWAFPSCQASISNKSPPPP